MRKSPTQRQSPLHKRHCIIWMGDYDRGAQGWWVRIYNQKLSRSFLVAEHGGKRAALQAAMRWRDRMHRKHPSIKLLRYKVRDKRSTTGVVGVCRNRQTKFTTDGKRRRVHWFWIANWTDMDGIVHKRAFSIKKYGETAARRLAIATRQRAIGRRSLRQLGKKT